MKKLLNLLGTSVLLISILSVSQCTNTSQNTDQIGVDTAAVDNSEKVPDTAAMRRNYTVVRMETTRGTMEFALYDATPKHKENFIKLAKSNFYKDLLFHRIIKSFMAQGGDPSSKNAKDEDTLGMGEIGYGIPAEFSDTIFHLKGSLCAARKPDIINPLKMSSGCQFYVVWGRKMDKNEYLKEDQAMGAYFGSPGGKADEKRFNEFLRTGNRIGISQISEVAKEKGRVILSERYANMPSKAKNLYANWGGAPHIDKEYTVFGFLLKGYDVLEEIMNTPCTPDLNRPKEAIKIIAVTVIKE